MWGRLKVVFFLVSLKLCFYYSLSVEITPKPPNWPFLGFPRALNRNSAQIRQKQPCQAPPLEVSLGRNQIKKAGRALQGDFSGAPRQKPVEVICREFLA
jgi:hypothetical protein